VADSGRSIFLEQHIEQRGKRSYFRWEIPYGYIHRIEEVSEPQPDAAAEPAPELPIVWPRRLALHKRPRRRLRSCDCRDAPKPPELLSFPTPQRRIGYNLLAFAR